MSEAGDKKTMTPEASAPDAVDNTVSTGPSTERGIHITERAAKEVVRVVAEQGFSADKTWVRIGAKGGGCSGFSYVLDFDQEGPGEFDLSYREHGVNLVIDKKSEFFMGGTTIDFNDGLLNRGFVFLNPSASGTCGCGLSFTT
ncbi:MAG: HesB/IscA family protein [Planctomycetota bacterium]|jgi:iron-sulfur cluster assembly protein